MSVVHDHFQVRTDESSVVRVGTNSFAIAIYSRKRARSNHNLSFEDNCQDGTDVTRDLIRQTITLYQLLEQETAS